MDVAAKIREYLEDKGITQSWLCGKTGIAPAKLNLVLNGRRRLTFAEYEMICWALEVDVGAFLEARPPAMGGYGLKASK